DWSSTPLGEPETWPQGLRTAVRILLTTQHPMFIWWGPDLIQFYNDAYCRTMGPERHPGALGQRGRECWDEIWDIIGPQIEMVIRGEGATWHEDQLVPVTRHGKRENVWWTYGYSPIDDESAPNGVGGVLVVCNDVTNQHLAFEASRTNERRLDLALSAGVIGTWDWDVQADRVYADTRFAQIYGVAPEAAKAGAPIASFIRTIHPDDQPRVNEKIQAAIASEGLFEDEYRLVQDAGDIRWVHARGRCLHDTNGKPAHFSGVALDITDRRTAEEQRRILADELAHRVKNLLATVQAIANQTLRSGRPIEEARDAFTARLMALSRAQDLLTGSGWVGADLRTLVAKTSEHLAGDANRLRIEGPNLQVSPRAALSLALTLHELATNAAKYGALSADTGRVDISWSVGFDGIFVLDWTESGGPLVEPPRRKGFGSRLIGGALTDEWGGTTTMKYNPEGIAWEVRAPVKNVREHDPLPNAS
ncbi:MAG TPA: HWE histidine kinase domain-containing protein, partial [Bryobacteraceae bacterium]|nr:HWE histidine kinase domain-containing protein [Bryobacteraceae bacterium]